jgi:hypothetical protein
MKEVWTTEWEPQAVQSKLNLAVNRHLALNLCFVVCRTQTGIHFCWTRSRTRSLVARDHRAWLETAPDGLLSAGDAVEIAHVGNRALYWIY